MTSTGPDGDLLPARYVAFADHVRIAEGDLEGVAAATWRSLEQRPLASVLVFDRETGEVVDLDLRGSACDVAARYRTPQAQAVAAKRGRPRLGVVAREVTLLPRHWEWLAQQPGGASTAVRRLVEAARKTDGGAARARSERAYRFMSAMAGDLPDFEDAARALFAEDPDGLGQLIAKWPADICSEVFKFIDVTRGGVCSPDTAHGSG